MERLSTSGYSLQTGRCTSTLSLAAPITAQYFFLDQPTHLRGMTIEGDILQVLGLTTDFQGYPSVMWQYQAEPDIVASNAFIRPLKKLLWGARLHDVQNNYINDTQNSPILKGFLQDLYDSCHGTP
jgi:hypothetical protein